MVTIDFFILLREPAIYDFGHLFDVQFLKAEPILKHENKIII